MRYYPLFLDLSDKEVLIAGAGTVGRRKLATLANAPVRGIMVVDPAGLEPEALPTLHEGTRLCIAQRAFLPEDLEGKTLVFAATPDAALNTRIAGLCKTRGILCNSASTPESGDFFVPSLYANEDITVAVSTDGKSPALARRIRKDLEGWMGNRYTGLARLLGRLRPELLFLALPSSDNARIFRALADSDILARLEERDMNGARRLLEAHLPECLHVKIEEFLYDL